MLSEHKLTGLMHTYVTHNNYSDSYSVKAHTGWRAGVCQIMVDDALLLLERWWPGRSMYVDTMQYTKHPHTRASSTHTRGCGEIYSKPRCARTPRVNERFIQAFHLPFTAFYCCSCCIQDCWLTHIFSHIIAKRTRSLGLSPTIHCILLLQLLCSRLLVDPYFLPHYCKKNERFRPFTYHSLHSTVVVVVFKIVG